MDFQKSYNRQDFLRFLRNDFLKEKFSEQIEETDLAKKINSRFFSKITKLWTALDLDNLIVLEIEHKSKNDARIGLTKDIFKLLRQYELEWIIRQHALVILTNPDSPDLYRLSLLTTTYNDKFEEKLSNPKRFSYLLWVWEKVKTANDFLFEKWNIKDFNDLENRFKVEVVRENFFNDYLNLYIRLYKSIVEAKDFHELLLKNNVDVVSFTKNLLWKIVFLYFIQKKWWFKNKETWIWDNLFFKNIWDDFNNKWEKNSIEKKNYFYNDYLEYIFYEWLNIENRDSDFSKKFWWEIPYLNWWLFKEDYPNWKENIAKISNDVFSNEKENWILDIFNLYNFTIDEDDLYDKEVAIDPEMLWKIFEKMISVDSKNIWKIVETYNEKSSKKRGEFITMDIENWNVWNNNKKLWAFYTPREIVHYMTKESLINYLINNLDWKKEDKEKKVRDLFDFKDKYLTDNDLSIEKIKNDFENVLSIVLDVNKKLKEVKILDPAIGSGAFPMWILHEISTLRYYIYDVLIKNVLWQKDYKNSMYDIKKEIIENNIYWVDIDPGAIDIARLRFWLSLIVDEETPEPLPNFEFKFVCANTLLPIEKEEKQLDMEWYIKDEAKLETLKKYKWEYFNISDKEKKEALKNRIRNYTALNNQQEFWYIPSKRAFQFNEFWSNFDNPKHSHSFFDPSLMMSEWRGFDIVIWNPPYIRHEDIKELKPLLKDYYTTYSWTSDLYCYFYEKWFTLLKQWWILSYITSNKFLKAKYWENIRKLFKNETIIKDIIDFWWYKVFDNATVDSIIFQFEKWFKPSNNFWVLEVKEKFINLKYYFDKEKFDVKQENLSNNSWTLWNNKILELKEKIEKQWIKLKDYCWEPKVWIKTWLNKILIVDKNLKNKIIWDNYIEDKIFKKVIFWKNITKYYSNFNNFFLIFPYIFDDNIWELKNIDLDNFPNTKSYLLNFYNDLKNRATFNNWKKEWFELQQINKNINFDSWYITFPDIWQKPSFSYQNGYSVDMTWFIIDKDDKYLLWLLNSKLIYFYFTLIASKLWNKWFRFKNQFINQLPIKQISIEEQKEIIFLVDEILKITNTAWYNPKDIPEKQKELENKIDRIVYELYWLEKEDIDVIEESLEK